MTWAVPGPCVRAAWLVLGGSTIALDNPAGGWFCTSLDLGSPEVRAVSVARPDADGLIDRTAYMGGRAVSADITALVGAGARIDDVADNFGVYMVPGARPTLHYVLDRPGGASERTLVLRPVAYNWKVQGADQRDISLQWIAPDPVARDPVSQTVTSWTGYSGGGRTYNLAFNRTYPAGGAGPSNATITSPGDVAVAPVLRIYGPIQGPQVTLSPSAGAPFRIWFSASFRVDAGHRCDVDTAAKTAYYDGDTTQNVLGSLDWNNTTWPRLPVAPASTTLSLAGTSTSGITQASATWSDGYLS